MLVMAIPLTAGAEGSVQLSVSVSPGELVEGGDVTVYVSVTNATSSDINDCMLIIDGSDVKEYSSLAPGQTAEYTGSYTVSTSKLSSAVPVQFTYSGGSVKSSFTINKKSANVKVGTIVKVDSTTVTKGSKSTFSFAIENQGDAKMENVKLVAPPLNGGKPLADAFNLSEGKVNMITYSEVLEEDSKITPQITFTVAGKEYQKTMDPVSVTVQDPDVKVEIKLKDPDTVIQPDKEFPVSIYIENTGNSDFKTIELFDNNEERVAIDKTSLSSGEFLSAEKNIKLSESKDIAFTLKATDSSGNSFTFNSNVLRVEVGAANPDDYTNLLVLKIEPKSDNLEKEGPAEFTVTIENKSEVELTELVVSEESLGEIQTYPSIEAGGTLSFDLKTVDDVTKETVFKFVLTAKDSDGKDITVEAEPVTITIGGGGIGALGIILIILAVLAVAAGVTVFILYKQEKIGKGANKNATSAKRPPVRPAAEQYVPTAQPVKRAKIRTATDEDDEPKDLNSFGFDDEPEEPEMPDEPEASQQEPEAAEPETAQRRVRRREYDDRNDF